MDSLEMAFSNMAVLYVGPFKPKMEYKDEARFQFMMRSTLISVFVFDSSLVFMRKSNGASIKSNLSSLNVLVVVNPSLEGSQYVEKKSWQ